MNSNHNVGKLTIISEMYAIFSCTFSGKANGAPPVYLVLVGSIPTPKFFSNFTKNFEGGADPERR